MNERRPADRPTGAPAADIRDVHDLDTPLGQEVLRIYEEAFPEAEREPVAEMAARLKKPDPASDVTHLRALVDRGTVLGFTYFSSYRAYWLGFLKFIAVRADQRGSGYGPLLLRDALQQVRADGRQATGWPYLGFVLEVERPEMAETDAERHIRQRRLAFYRRNGAVLLEGIDYVAPPVAPGQPDMPFHLMLLRAVPKYGMLRWIRPQAVRALLVKGYGEAPDSWYVRHALGVRSHARRPAAVGGS